MSRPVGGAGELTGYGWNVEQILVYIWQNLSGGSSEREYPYSRFANSEAGKRLRIELTGLAAEAPQGVPAPKPAPPISEFTPEDMPVVTVSTGAPPNASPPSWRRSLAEKAKDEMSEFEKGFPYDGVTPVPGAERPMLEDLPHKIANRILTDDHGSSFYKWGLGEIERLVREALAAAPSAPSEHPQLGTHLQHCNFGEHENTCKYGDENCPALSEGWSWFGKALQNRDLIQSRAYNNGFDHGKVAAGHASAERVRQLEAALSKAQKIIQSELERSQQRGWADWIAEIERALLPSTGEKS